MIGKPALPSIAGLGLQFVDQIDDVIEAAEGAVADAATADGDSQMGLAGPRCARSGRRPNADRPQGPAWH